MPAPRLDRRLHGRFRRHPSNGDTSHSMGIDSRTIWPPNAVRTGKSPEIRGTAKIGTAFAMQSASVRGDARSQRERKKWTVKPPTSSAAATRSEEHTSELQSLMRTSYAVFCLKKKKNNEHI